MATDLVIDAHVHVASGDLDRYPRQISGAASTWWRAGGDASSLVANLDASGVDRAVVVQAIGVYGYDCSYAAEVVRSGGGRFALVGAVDMFGDDVSGVVAELFSATDLAGLRLFGVSAAGDSWLTNGTGAAVWHQVEGTGCVLVPTIFNAGLPALRALIEARPEVVVALDHCAFPDLGGPDAMGDLLGLADLPSLHLKVTSHNLDSGEDPADFLEPLVEAYGEERVCWGSDHPQHDTRTYAEMVALATRACRRLSPTARSAFLGGNSRRLWWPSE